MSPDASSCCRPVRLPRLRARRRGVCRRVQRFSLINALAQGADYKALVCVFLAGGNDGNNMIVPTSTTDYNATRRPQRRRAGHRARHAAAGDAAEHRQPVRPAPEPGRSPDAVDEPEAVGGLQRRPAGSAVDPRGVSSAAHRVPTSCSRIPIRSRSGRPRSPIAVARPAGAAAPPIASARTAPGSR